MNTRWMRSALGGVLTGVVSFFGSAAAHAQQPGSPPAGALPIPPDLPALPGIPGQPTYLPADPGAQPLPGATGQPMPPATGTGQPATGGTGTPMGAGSSGGSGSGSAAPAPADPGKPKWEINWNTPAAGLFIQSIDKRFAFHMGATVQYDFVWYAADASLEQGTRAADLGVGRFEDAANLRRARMFFEGTLWEALDFKFEIEFMNGIGFSPPGTTNPTVAGSVTNSPGPTDAWLNVKDVPFLGNVRIGNQKEWFSLEHLNNYRALEFLERSYLFDFTQATAFNNGFTPGISVWRTWANDRLFSAIGVYKNESDLIGFGIGDGQYAVTGRLAALPVWMPDEKVFWHFGGAFSHRDPVDGRVQIRIRDNIRNAPFPLLPLVANTGVLDATSQDLFNVETAAVYGPLTLQAEYTANVLRGARTSATLTAPAGPPQGDLFFQGCYAEAMLLLTGESRTFNNKTYALNRVLPKRPLKLKPSDCDGYGCGAWELAVRYSYIDLSNKAIMAGRLDSVTFGVNWYMNANAKLQFNYDVTHRGDTNNTVQGTVHGFGLRSQFDF